MLRGLSRTSLPRVQPRSFAVAAIRHSSTLERMKELEVKADELLALPNFPLTLKPLFEKIVRPPTPTHPYPDHRGRVSANGLGRLPPHALIASILTPLSFLAWTTVSPIPPPLAITSVAVVCAVRKRSELRTRRGPRSIRSMPRVSRRRSRR